MAAWVANGPRVTIADPRTPGQHCRGAPPVGRAGLVAQVMRRCGISRRQGVQTADSSSLPARRRTWVTPRARERGQEFSGVVSAILELKNRTVDFCQGIASA